jgi:hypothetical protein
MVLIADGAADMHRGADAPVLVEGHVVGAVVVGLHPDLVGGAVALQHAVLRGGPVVRWVVHAHRLDDVPFHDGNVAVRVRTPSVQGEVGVGA